MENITVLVDCSHISYTVYYGLKDKTDEVAFLSLFMNRILQIIQMNKTLNLVFCWDSQTSIRKKVFHEYKEERVEKKEKEKEELKMMFEQRTIMREIILPMIGFTSYVDVDGYEADDTMASIVERNPNKRFLIVANDSDLYQILRFNNLIGIFSCRTNSLYKRADFIEEYNIPVSQWYLVKALAGCHSDSVKGIPRVGIPTAIKFLKGEMSDNDVAYKNITSKDGVKIFRKNLWLTKIPLKGFPTGPIKIAKNNFDLKKLKEVRELFKLSLKVGEWAVAVKHIER